MSDRKFSEIREAYELWVTGCTHDGVPMEPKPTYDMEFSAFTQGYMFGRMTDSDFGVVIARQAAERMQEPVKF